MTTRLASCSCGQLSISCEGEPMRVSLCHCLGCQRRTGSVFGVTARFPDADVRVEGVSTTYVRVGDSGGAATFHFCPRCGSSVYWKADQIPGVTAVAVGAFADPNFPAPTVAVYDGRRHAWVQPPEGVEQLD
ncbi:MAG: GFA family protein [Alphaproteobacteria bacterium]